VGTNASVYALGRGSSVLCQSFWGITSEGSGTQGAKGGGGGGDKEGTVRRTTNPAWVPCLNSRSQATARGREKESRGGAK